MPPFQYSPVGGFKVALEYANRLAIDGYHVHIVYADATKYKDGLSFKLKMKLLIKHYLFKLKILHRSIRIWFPLDKRVKEHNVFKLKYHYVPKTDIYIYVPLLILLLILTNIRLSLRENFILYKAMKIGEEQIKK